MCFVSTAVVVVFKVILLCTSVLKFADGQNIIGADVKRNYTFPDDFMFGVSSSAFQVEGAWNEDGKGESIWDTYLHNQPSSTLDHSNGDVATDSYHRYMEDIDMIKKLGVRFYRTSISWPRKNVIAEPNRVFTFAPPVINRKGVLHYRKFFKELLRAKIVPIITLYHWDLPTSLNNLGGWCSAKVVDYFEDYARVVFQLFGDLIKNWMTFNEIHHHCFTSYGSNINPPALSSPGIGVYLCMHYMLLAHSRAYRLYDEQFRPTQKGKIGLTLDMNFVAAKNTDSVADQEAAHRYLQMHIGIISHPIFSKTGDYPERVKTIVDKMSHIQGYSKSRLPSFTDEEIKALRGSADFLGVNHYSTSVVSTSAMEKEWEIPSIDHDTGVKIEQNPSWPVPGVNWLSVDPPGFRQLINWLTQNYGSEVPIIIMENGMSDDGRLEDYERVSYINDYLYQLLLAIHEDKCNVQGYFIWSLMDSMEWEEGYTVKFGLYSVDFSTPNLTRTPKISAKNYENIVRTHYIDFDYVKNRRTQFFKELL